MRPVIAKHNDFAITGQAPEGKEQRTMQMRTGVYWSVGAGHKRNQDSLSLQHVALQRGECLLALVCDGIGSLACSQEAGSYVVHQMTDWFYHEGKELIFQSNTKELILFSLHRQFCRIQEHLKQFQLTQHIQTGTTCSGILIVKDRYYLMHIGDSRIYHIRAKAVPTRRQACRVRCMTADDRDDQGHLCKCLGMAGADHVYLDTGRLKRHTCLLLATDGFCFGAPESRLGQALGPCLFAGSGKGERGSRYYAEEGLDRRLELLGEWAARAGSRDDMAAIGIVIL
ncbi:protein phosphatase 2C domain-containing protein [Lachnospiraceae bacterium JLR.KK008]